MKKFLILNTNCNVTDDKYHVASHTHHFYQWYCVIEGTVTYKIKNEIIKLESHDSLFIAPGTTRQPISAKIGTRYMWFGVNFIDIDIPKFDFSLIKIPVGLHLDLEEIYSEVKKPGLKYTKEYFYFVFGRMLFFLLRQLWNETNSGGLEKKYNRDIVNAVEQYLKMNIGLPVSRDDISRLTGYSSAQIARIFKQATGVTLHQRLTSNRIEVAQTLLRKSDLPITEISVVVGFNSFSHFTQLFKEVIKLSPSEYRIQYSDHLDQK